MKHRFDELVVFLEEQVYEVTEYEEGLIRRLVERITVFDDHLTVELRTGIETEVKM